MHDFHSHVDVFPLMLKVIEEGGVTPPPFPVTLLQPFSCFLGPDGVKGERDQAFHLGSEKVYSRCPVHVLGAAEVNFNKQKIHKK